jgi:hypothetical protein
MSHGVRYNTECRVWPPHPDVHAAGSRNNRIVLLPLLHPNYLPNYSAAKPSHIHRPPVPVSFAVHCQKYPITFIINITMYDVMFVCQTLAATKPTVSGLMLTFRNRASYI